MTRETKIGIAVAVSFLCLVGIVVATKWGGKADPDKGGANAQAKAKQPNLQQSARSTRRSNAVETG